MRFAIESWSPTYGAPTGDEVLDEGVAEVDPFVEVGPDDWAPVGPPANTVPLGQVLFVDGVRRVEANVWITDAAGEVHQGICASYAAGAVCCDGEARLVGAEVRRGLFVASPSAESIDTRHAHFAVHVVNAGDDLSIRLQDKMAELEAHVAAQVGDVELAMADGPLKFGQNRTGLVGYVKTHHSVYGPPLVRQVVTRLDVGQRTPIMLFGARRFPRFSWYLRLPCAVAHGWAGVVRLEVCAEQPVKAAAALADRLCVSLGRFASRPQKDPRAPQNLYPIGGLERDLRRRLGDPTLILRSLQQRAASAA